MSETPVTLNGEQRVALITGAAKGVGRTTATVFAEAGEEVSRDLRQRFPEVGFVATNVSDPDQARYAVEAAVERWGQLDLVLNNAGISGHGSLIEALDSADLDRVIGVNLKGPFHICMHAIPAMRRNGGGVILNVSSITAELGSAFYAPYAATKAAVVALTRGLARRAGRYNIRVNCISPGSIEGTGLMSEERASVDLEVRLAQNLAKIKNIPLGRAAHPRDIAYLALFLGSAMARHIHGAVMTVDGGESLGYQ